MKILLINGAQKEHPLGELATQALDQMLTQKGHLCTISTLSALTLKPCISCDTCQIKKPGLCILDDGLNDLLKQYMASNLVIILTPITFGTCNVLTKIFLDRTQPLYMPYQKRSTNLMAPRYTKYPDIHFLGLADEASLGADHFKTALLNCTLALQSKQRQLDVIHTLSDLQSIHF